MIVILTVANYSKMVSSRRCHRIYRLIHAGSEYFYICFSCNLIDVSCRYVEFYDVMSVPMAIALSGQPLLGQPVMVKPSEAEKNLVQSTAAGSAGLTGPQSAAARKLYVGNLHTNITEDQLRQVMTISVLYRNHIFIHLTS